MKVLTLGARVHCDHDGAVGLTAQQAMVRVGGIPVLVGDDPVGRTIARCPNSGPNIKRCQRTLAVRQGHSRFVTVDGRPWCLDDLRGFTDGTPPGLVAYTVRRPGQGLVEVGS